MGPVYKERILDEIERRLIPDIRSRIVTSFHYAPPDFAHDLRAHLGSAFSLEPTLTQSAFFRTHNRDDMIHNLYFVGAGTHPGAGIPSVVASAKATAGLMIEDLRLRSEEHTSELQSLMRISYAVFCLKKKRYKQERL